MRLFGKKKGKSVISTNVIFIDGHDLFSLGEDVTFSWDSNERKVIIQSRLPKNKGKKVSIDIDKIRAAQLSREDIVMKQINILGRDLVSGLFLGPLGTGGISGVGVKKVKKINHFIVINYNEDDMIVLKPRDILSYRKVLDAINENIKPGDIEL
jgi:hypothetical protein